MYNVVYHDEHTFFPYTIPLNNYLLYQTGEMYCKKDTVLCEHPQICYEITFAVDGIGSSGAPELETLNKNDFFFSLSQEQHAVATDTQKPLRFHFLGFSPRPGTVGERYIAAIENCIKESGQRVLNLPEIHPYLDEILSEVKQETLLSLDVIDNLISLILIEIIRAYSSVEKQQIAHAVTSESMLVYEMIAFLDENACRMRNLKEMAEHFNYCQSYLSALFHKIMSISLHSYFQKVKMEKAKLLLHKDGKSITQVSLELNYSSVHSFSRSYKNYFGVSPSQDV